MNNPPCACDSLGNPCPIHKLVIFRNPDGTYSRIYTMRKIQNANIQPEQFAGCIERNYSFLNRNTGQEAGYNQGVYQHSYSSTPKLRKFVGAMTSTSDQTQQNSPNCQNITTSSSMANHCPRSQTTTLSAIRPSVSSKCFAPCEHCRLNFEKNAVLDTSGAHQSLRIGGTLTPLERNLSTATIRSIQTKGASKPKPTRVSIVDSSTSVRSHRMDFFADGRRTTEAQALETTIYKAKSTSPNRSPLLGKTQDERVLPDLPLHRQATQSQEHTSHPRQMAPETHVPPFYMDDNYLSAYHKLNLYSVEPQGTACCQKDWKVITRNPFTVDGQTLPVCCRNQLGPNEILARACCRSNSNIVKPQTPASCSTEFKEIPSERAKLPCCSRQQPKSSSEFLARPSYSERKDKSKQNSCRANTSLKDILTVTIKCLDQAVQSLHKSHDKKNFIELPANPEELNKKLAENIQNNQQHIKELKQAVQIMLKELHFILKNEPEKARQVSSLLTNLRCNELTDQSNNANIFCLPAKSNVSDDAKSELEMITSLPKTTQDAQDIPLEQQITAETDTLGP